MAKPCEFEGWIEVDKDIDPVKPGDIWLPNFENPNEITQERMDQLLVCYWAVGLPATKYWHTTTVSHLRLLRRKPTSRRLALNKIHSEPVPLP